MTIRTLGFREWLFPGDTDRGYVNLYRGCVNGCRYCFQCRRAVRFGYVAGPDDWAVMRPLRSIGVTVIDATGRNRKGGIDRYYPRATVQFPTSHDIPSPGSHPDFFSACLRTLRVLLAAGNHVLVTTKPAPDAIRIIVSDPVVRAAKENLILRFTVTTIDDEIRKRWEPGAPSIPARFESIRIAREAGFPVTISIEPFLDADPLPLIDSLARAGAGPIWLGPMNYVPDTPDHAGIRAMIAPARLAEIAARAAGKVILKDTFRSLVNEYRT